MVDPIQGFEESNIRAFRAALRQLVRKVDRRLRNEVQCCGVGYLMSHILLELEQNEPLSLKQLQEALGVDKATLSRSVDWLVKDGLVSRKTDPADRRAIVLTLTAAGRKQVANLNRRSNDGCRALFERIPAREHAAVLSAVGYLSSALEQVGIDSGYPARDDGVKTAPALTASSSRPSCRSTTTGRHASASCPKG